MVSKLLIGLVLVTILGSNVQVEAGKDGRGKDSGQIEETKSQTISKTRARNLDAEERNSRNKVSDNEAGTRQHIKNLYEGKISSALVKEHLVKPHQVVSSQVESEEESARKMLKESFQSGKDRIINKERLSGKQTDPLKEKLAKAKKAAKNKTSETRVEELKAEHSKAALKAKETRAQEEAATIKYQQKLHQLIDKTNQVEQKRAELSRMLQQRKELEAKLKVTEQQKRVTERRLN